MPMCCFPPIHWIALAMREGTVIDVHENYVKQTFRNRFDVLGVNGRITLSIPVVGQKGVKTPFHNIQLADKSWRKLHLTTIRSAYGRAAYFEHYFKEVEEIFMSEQTSLLELNVQILHWIGKCGIPFKFELSQTHVEGVEHDYRSAFEPANKWDELNAYPQVFSDRIPFEQNLSVLDLLMNKGPIAIEYLLNINSIKSS